MVRFLINISLYSIWLSALANKMIDGSAHEKNTNLFNRS